MQKSIQLKPKQLVALKETQNQKQQLAKVLQEVNQQEALLINLIFESADLDLNLASDIKLENDCVVFTEISKEEIIEKANSEKKLKVSKK